MQQRHCISVNLQREVSVNVFWVKSPLHLIKSVVSVSVWNEDEHISVTRSNSEYILTNTYNKWSWNQNTSDLNMDNPKLTLDLDLRGYRKEDLPTMSKYLFKNPKIFQYLFWEILTFHITPWSLHLLVFCSLCWVNYSNLTSGQYGSFLCNNTLCFLYFYEKTQQNSNGIITVGRNVTCWGLNI